MMLQQDQPGDYVIGTGEAHSVQEFLEEAFAYADLDWKEYVEIDPRYFRPTDVAYLLANASRAQEVLGWVPKVTFKELVRIMVDADMEALGLDAIGEGRRIMEGKFSGWHRWQSSITALQRAKRGGVE